MSIIPLIVRLAGMKARRDELQLDQSTDDGLLPQVVAVDEYGAAMTRLTRMTKVIEETTDDD